MGQTQNFGLEKFGPEGSLAQNGHKFTLKDRETLDALLYALFNHDHRLTSATALVEPIRPTLTLGTGGQITAGTTYYYRISLVDEYGTETGASQEAVAICDPPLTPPARSNLQVTPSGGALAAGVYRYALTFYDASGETNAPNTAQTTTTGGTSQITVSLPSPGDATGWKIYRKGPGDSDYYLLDTVAALATPQTDYIDDGSLESDAHKVRPTKNTTNSGRSVSIEFNALDLPLDSRVKRWRVYRTRTSGSYPSSSLVATITDTTTEGGTELVTSYVDLGFSTFQGVPLTLSSTAPAIPQLDASHVFDTTAGRLPKAVAPREVGTWSGYMLAAGEDYFTFSASHTTGATLKSSTSKIREQTTDTIIWKDKERHQKTDALLVKGQNGLQGREYARTVPTTDMGIERFDFFFLDPPEVDADNKLDLIATNGQVTVSIPVTVKRQAYSWVSSTTDADEQEAESIGGAPGTTQSDILATNDSAREISSQNQEIVWDCGMLDEGSYTFKFYVRDVGQTNGTLVLQVRDNSSHAVLATTTLNSPATNFYEPPQELSYTVPSGGRGIELGAKKTDANGNAFRVDKFAYEYENPTFAEGAEVRVYVAVTGTPTFNGDRANWVLWY